MDGRDVVEYYATRFQEEFCFRDAKQFLGLTDCQARDKRKLEFAFNSSFTALNVAKIMCKEHETSIGRLKAQMINAYYAQRIIDVFEKNPNTPLNKERINYCCPVKINRKLCIPLLIGVAAVLLIQGLGFQS